VKPDNILEYARAVEPHWSHKSGLVLAFAIELILLTAFWASLPGERAGGIQITQNDPAWGISVGALWIATFLAWHHMRAMPKFKANQIGILVSLQSMHQDSETQKVLLSLYRRLLADEKDLPGIVVQRLPSNHAIENGQHALELLTKSHGILAVWCLAQSGRVQGRETVQIERINFTVRHPPLPRQQHIELAKTLALALVGRKWSIAKENDIIDTAVVAGNLSEVSSYNLGLALLVGNEPSRAIPLLEDVLQRLGTPSAADPKNSLAGKVREAAFIAYFRAYGEPWLTFADRSDRQKQDHHAFIATRRIKLQPQEPVGYRGLAICEFLRGDLAAARRNSALAKDRSPKGDGSYYYSAGFLDFWEGRHRRGVQNYKRAVRRTLPPGTLDNIILWLEQVLDSEPARWIFYLALGIIHESKGDVTKAKRHYEIVVEKAGPNPDFQWEQGLADEALGRLAESGVRQDGPSTSEVASAG
jgi:tetratricopeptide (TPR) repeat protein